MDYSPTLLAQADAVHRFPLQGNSKTICYCSWTLYMHMCAAENLAAVQYLFDNTATDAIINNATVMTVGALSAKPFVAACCCCSLLLFMALFQ